MLGINRFSMLFLLNVFKNLNLCTSYIKQMNVFSFLKWNKELNGTFHLSPHENIFTIALKNIHYLYNIHLLGKNIAPVLLIVCRYWYYVLPEKLGDTHSNEKGNQVSFWPLCNAMGAIAFLITHCEFTVPPDCFAMISINFCSCSA